VNTDRAPDGHQASSSQTTWDASLPVGCYNSQPPNPPSLNPKADLILPSNRRQKAGSIHCSNSVQPNYGLCSFHYPTFYDNKLVIWAFNVPFQNKYCYVRDYITLHYKLFKVA